MSKITDSARDEDCTISLPGVCCGDATTTVFCHSNLVSDGKGRGFKARDAHGNDVGAYGCYRCHDVVDGRVKRPRWMSYDEMLVHFANGIEKTKVLLAAKRLLKFAEIA